MEREKVPWAAYEDLNDINCAGDSAATMLHGYQIEPSLGVMLEALADGVSYVTIGALGEGNEGYEVGYVGGVDDGYHSNETDLRRGVADCLAWELYLSEK